MASTDGFELAENDLEIRGEGRSSARASRGSPTSASRGSRQDRELLEEARDTARSLPAETMVAEVEALLGGAEHLGESERSRRACSS